MLTEARKQSMADDLQRFWDYLPETEVFVCVWPNFEQAEGVYAAAAADEGTPLDAPFRCFAFESAQSDRPLAMVYNGKTDTQLFCLMVCEVDATTRVYYGLVADEKGQLHPFCDHMNDHDACGRLTRVFLKLLATASDGVEYVHQPIRVRTASPKTKRYHELRRVFHIRPHKLRFTRLPGEDRTPRKIDWSHQWSVRGHWVRFWTDDTRTQLDTTRIGKNRAGEPVERGRTWRRSYTKGPEGKLAVKKTRVVHAGEASAL